MPSMSYLQLTHIIQGIQETLPEGLRPEIEEQIMLTVTRNLCRHYNLRESRFRSYLFRSRSVMPLDIVPDSRIFAETQEVIRGVGIIAYLDLVSQAVDDVDGPIGRMASNAIRALARDLSSDLRYRTDQDTLPQGTPPADYPGHLE